MTSRLNEWMKAHFLGLMAAMVTFGLLWPGAGLWLKDLTLLKVPFTHWRYDFPNLALGLMMLCAAVQCRFSDFRHLWQRPAATFAGLGTIYLLVPAGVGLAGHLLSHTMSGPQGVQLQVGLLLSALMPVAMTSSVWVRLNAGNLPLLVSFIALTTSLSVVTVPIYFRVLLGGAAGSAPLPLDGILQQLLLSVTLPLCAGLGLRHRAPALTRRWSGLFMLLGNLSLWAAVLANLGVAAPHVKGELHVVAQMALWTVLINLACFVAGLWVARWAKLCREDMVSLVFGCGMRSNSTGLLIGLTLFPALPLVSIPAAVYMVSQHLLGALLTRTLEQREAQVLGKAVAHDPESLRVHLRRSLTPRAQGGGVAVLMFQMTYPSPRAIAQVARQVRARVRPTDFVCCLPRGFALVLHRTSERGVGLVTLRVESLVMHADPLAELASGAARVTHLHHTGDELIRSATLALTLRSPRAPTR